MKENKKISTVAFIYAGLSKHQKCTVYSNTMKDINQNVCVCTNNSYACCKFQGLCNQDIVINCEQENRGMCLCVIS